MIEELLKKLPEQYQDVEFEGKVYPGVRKCEKRLKRIADVIPSGVVLEIGSAQGYFTSKLATKDRLLISIESERENTELQSFLFKDRKNIIVCQKLLIPEMIEKWSSAVSTVDCVLMMSVLHHFENPLRMLEAVAGLTPCLVIELAQPEEKRACGSGSRNITESDLKKYYSHVEFIGEELSHTDDVARPTYLCLKDIKKDKLKPYASIKVDGHREHTLEYLQNDKEWILDGSVAKKGINLFDVMRFGIVSPSRQWIADQAVKAYEKIENPTDVRVWNLIWTLDGIEAIDYKDQFEELKLKSGDIEKVVEMIL